MNRATVFFSVGFRPFFLLAGVAALTPVLAWVFSVGGLPSDFTPDGLIIWHAHEMIFGYAVAVIAGFLSTAVRNWTGLQTVQDRSLQLLVLLWLFGRLLPWLELPRVLMAVVDVAFLPAFAFFITRPLLAAKQRQNLVFPAMLLGLAALNAAVHTAVLAGNHTLAGQLLSGTVLLVTVMISVMGGRIIPRFTENGIATDFTARAWRGIEAVATPAMAATAAAVLLVPESPVLTVVALFAAVVHLWRLAGWYTAAIWRVPLVWVLQVGYAWLGIGLLLIACSTPAVGLASFMPALHALTVGGMGMITLGMMARVSLGHTGRPIRATPAITTMFVLVSVAALLRVFGVMLLPAAGLNLVALAGVAWSLAFLIFLWVYLPVLTAPRVR